MNKSMRSIIEEISAINKQLSVDYLCLPFDLVEDILCRLPVKSLLRFRCVCKSWNSLLSDHKFSKKHLNLSTTRRLHFLSYCDFDKKYIFTSCPLYYVFTTVPTDVTRLPYPSNKNHGFTHHDIIGSCNGILCLFHCYSGMSFVVLWNPSIRKVKELPPLHYPRRVFPTFGFGYDFVTDNYKVVAILPERVPDSSGSWVYKTEVKVNTLGTNFWKNIQEFPFDSTPCAGYPGKFVSGTINWLASQRWRESSCFIVSLDLRKENYQKFLLPNCGVDVSILDLSVLRDCLSIIYGHDVWIMKEYGNNESWSKLFSVTNMQLNGRNLKMSYHLTKTIYTFKDGRVLLEFVTDKFFKLIVYDPMNDTFKFMKFQNKSSYDPIFVNNSLEVCIESLISPYF